MVYTASHNIISSLGFTSTENYNNIKAGKTGIKNSSENLAPEISAVSLVDTDILEKKFSEISDKNGSYTRYEKLLICSVADALKKTDIKPDSPETLFIVSTTKGNINLREKKYHNQYKNDRIQLWKASEKISSFFNYKRKPTTISNACISGSLALIIAQRLIDTGTYKNAIVTGGDILSEYTLSGFQAFKAVSFAACIPFDAKRNGMTPGEGAATIILTSDQNKSLPEKIMITGGASSNDANHISGPSRTGEELALSIKSAMAEAGLNAKDIDHIAAHGTATPYNDEMESKALTISGLQNVPLNSIKGNIGHTFGAAGIAESIIAIESMRNNEFLSSRGYSEQGTSKPLNIIQKNKTAELRSVLKTASGFGGSNAALILSKKQNTNAVAEKKNFIIKKSVTIKDFKIITDSEKKDYSHHENIKLANDFENKFKIFVKLLYKEKQIKYSKFYKMDNLCKLAFIASEFLLENTNLSKLGPEKTAIILSNGSSSSSSDQKYQQTINNRDNYFPSPKIFVYTLANIMIGEMSIRNGFKGENAVFIEKDFNKDFIFEYTKLLFNKNKAVRAIAGRVDYDNFNSEFFVELYLIEKDI